MTRKLHIGGTVASEGWEVLNANPAPYVDHVGNAGDLSRFGDASFQQVYASHVLEHFDYKEELLKTLTEWRRVLVPGGTLLVSVPDLDVLAGLLLHKDRLGPEDRFFVMRMIFGGHVDRHDYHLAGLNQDFLSAFLHAAGYVNFRRVEGLGLFEDTSTMVYKGVAISLNMIAEKARA